MRTCDEILREIAARFGNVPPFFVPAAETPALLEMLWGRLGPLLEAEPALAALFTEHREQGSVECPERMQQLLTEIGRLRLTEDLLRRSEHLYRALFRNFPNGMVFLLDTELRYLIADGMGMEAAGLSREELEGRTLRETLDPDLCDRVEPMLRQVLEGRSTDGELVHGGRTYEIRAVPVHTDDDPATEALVIAQDVTEQKRMEAHLAQAQKMESIGRLAGGVAHDFNNLLTVIIGYTDMLSAHMGGDPSLELFLQHIKQSAGRAADLTQQLLAFASKQVVRPRAIGVNELIRSLERLLRRLLGEPIELRLSLSRGGDTVHADPAQIQQVLINLAANARDAMPDGGVLTIETRSVRLSRSPASERDMEPGPCVEITVRDTGAGMTEAVRGRVFEPFYTTREQGKGVGLGLAICYGIVRQNRGDIAVESAPGQGSLFRILLPRIAATEKPAPLAEPSALHGTETILVVEDEQTVRDLVREVLQAHGYGLLIASNGVEALAMAEQHPERIDLLLTDVMMPQMGGEELAIRLRERSPKLNVMLMSGYTHGASGLSQDLLEGCVFLPKPFLPSALLAKVREALDRPVNDEPVAG